MGRAALFGVTVPSTKESRGYSPMTGIQYAVHVRAAKRPKVLIATSPDIRGLVLEVKSVDELHSELLRVTERLLRMNHGLTDEELSTVQLNVTLHGHERHSSAPRISRILFDDQRVAAVVA